MDLFEAITEHFKPNQTAKYMYSIFHFIQQIDGYYAELRPPATHCKFPNPDEEIYEKSTCNQNASLRLRRI